jgi:preprotein translocase subunit YajC
VDRYYPLILILLVVVMLFVLPARQRKRVQAQQQQLQDSLQVGTQVMTTSGLYGTVARTSDDTIDLEISPGVVVTFVRRAVLEVRKPAEDVPGTGTVSGDSTDGTAGPADGAI